MAELIFFRHGERLMRVSLDRDQVTLGRGPQNDVAIPDESVSRQQAVLERRGNATVLRDLSGRGTIVNGKPHKELALDDGAEITLGDWRGRFQSQSVADVVVTKVNKKLGGTDLQERPNPLIGAGALQLRVRGTSGERVLPIEADELSIGKDDENQLVLDDHFVSSFHAVLARTPRGFWLKDLGSTNGTFINGAKVREGEVELGAHVRVGESELVLEVVPGAKEGGDEGFEGIIGRDPSIRQLFELIGRVAPSGVAVTIFGETGTGKELVARAIHARSQRRDKPFVPVNCAAITKELIESELFGHEKGAFTGADRLRLGAFEEANGGTLFLDEIGELSLDLQAKLLRALESGEIRRVGSSKPIHVDARIVAATHQDLLGLAKRGKFREDLYYRLCVFPLTLPPLRRRLADLALLTDHFVKRFSPTNTLVTVSSAARTKLAQHPFSGNIRELRNVVHRALLLREGPIIEENQIVFDASTAESDVNQGSGSGVSERADDDEYLYLPDQTLEQLETEIMLRCVRRHGGQKSPAAKELGISRSTLSKRLGGDE
jgi:DNA-binding NtrC family response regulator